MSTDKITELKDLRKIINPNSSQEEFESVTDLRKALTEDLINYGEESLSKLSNEDLAKIMREIALPGTLETAKGVVPSKPQFANFSIINWSLDFMQKTTMTANVAYIYRMAEEYLLADTEEEKEQRKSEYKIIKKFLDRCYEYDPNRHTCPLFEEKNEDRTPEEIVELCKNENTEPPKELTTEEQLACAVRIIEKLSEGIKASPVRAKMALEEVNKTWSIDTKDIKVNLPYDAFVKFRSYYESNYESIVKAMEAIYNYASDIGFMVLFHNAHDTQEEAIKWREMNADNLMFDLYTIENNRIVYLGPHKNSKDKVEFYDKHNKLLKKLFEVQERDYEVGKSMIKERIKHTKRSNIASDGKINPDLLRLYSKDIARIHDLQAKDSLTYEEREELDMLVHEVNKPDPDSIQIKVFEPTLGEDSLDIRQKRLYVKSKETKTLNQLEK